MDDKVKPGLPDAVFHDRIYRVVLSKPCKDSISSDGRSYVRIEIVLNDNKYQASMYTDKQVFHKNIGKDSIKPFLDSMFAASFMQYTAWDGDFEYAASITKRGDVRTYRQATRNQPRKKNYAGGSFNQQKNYIIKEGDFVPALVDMGVFTKDCKVSSGMNDKFRQINRFLELMSDEIRVERIGGTAEFNIIDFGCGKSYLTFVIYHYLSKVRKLRTRICGVDSNADIVKTCSNAAIKYGYDSLSFVHGDIAALPEPPISDWGKPGTMNIIVCLHACDTATDYALFNAVKWKADLIFAAPCCQHELAAQMDPRSLKLFAEYGIIKERVAALATDAIRAKLLECVGYKAQIVEFTGMEHTPKNLLIRAKRSKTKANASAFASLKDVLDEFSFEPMLLKLLREGGFT